MEKELENYISGESKYTPIMNVLFSYENDYYADLGKYLINLFGRDNLPNNLKHIAERLRTRIEKNIPDFRGTDRIYSMIGMEFIISTLDKKSLSVMYSLKDLVDIYKKEKV